MTRQAGSATIATIRPSMRLEDRHDRRGDRPPDRPLEDEDREGRADRERRRGRDAPRPLTSRRSLTPSPATTRPRTPRALARVIASASMDDPTTRIVPALATSISEARTWPSRARGSGGSRPELGPPRTSELRGGPEPASRRQEPEPGTTSRTMPSNGASRGSACSPVAMRHRPPLRKRNSPRSALGPRRGRRRRATSPRFRGGRSLDDVGPRLPKALGELRAADDSLAGRYQRALARAETEGRHDRRHGERPNVDEREVDRRRVYHIPPGPSGRSRGSPGQAWAPHSASTVRRRSRRSGRLSGTSRRSDQSPRARRSPGPSLCRVRLPRRTSSENSRRAAARAPGRRSTKASSPAARSRWSTRPVVEVRGARLAIGSGRARAGDPAGRPRRAGCRAGRGRRRGGR